MKLIVYIECGWNGDVEIARDVILGLNPDSIVDIGTKDVKRVLKNIEIPIEVAYPNTLTHERMQTQFHIDVLNNMNPDVYVGFHEDIAKSKFIIRSLVRAQKEGKIVYVHDGKTLNVFEG